MHRLDHNFFDVEPIVDVGMRGLLVEDGLRSTQPNRDGNLRGQQDFAEGVDGGIGEFAHGVVDHPSLERTGLVQGSRKIGIALAPVVDGRAVDTNVPGDGGDVGAGEKKLDGSLLQGGELVRRYFV